MKRQEFIDAVYYAGWRATADAQHEGINELWEKIYPTAAAIEREHGFPSVNGRCFHPNCDCDDYCKAVDPHSTPVMRATMAEEQNSVELNEALSLAVKNKSNAEWESATKQRCLEDALRELPSGMAEMVWDEFNELMRKARIGKYVRLSDE